MSIYLFQSSFQQIENFIAYLAYIGVIDLSACSVYNQDRFHLIKVRPFSWQFERREVCVKRTTDFRRFDILIETVMYIKMKKHSVQFVIELHLKCKYCCVKYQITELDASFFCDVYHYVNSLKSQNRAKCVLSKFLIIFK